MNSDAASVDTDAASDSEWLLKVCKFVTNNTEDFCTDVYASHLLRTCSECLTGGRAQQGQGANQARTEGYDLRRTWRFSGDNDTVKVCFPFYSVNFAKCTVVQSLTTYDVCRSVRRCWKSSPTGWWPLTRTASPPSSVSGWSPSSVRSAPVGWW